jgi:hypothetical protein
MQLTQQDWPRIKEAHTRPDVYSTGNVPMRLSSIMIASIRRLHVYLSINSAAQLILNKWHTSHNLNATDIVSSLLNCMFYNVLIIMPSFFCFVDTVLISTTDTLSVILISEWASVLDTVYISEESAIVAVVI